jgi:hypothetical protein
VTLHGGDLGRNDRADEIGSLSVMANRPAPRNSRLDAATAERLLSAAGLPEYPRLAELLAAAAVPDSRKPLSGEEAAIAAYRFANTAGAETARAGSADGRSKTRVRGS